MRIFDKKRDEPKEKSSTGKTVKIKILLPVAGKFHLSYDLGKTYNVNPNQAKELIAAGYAEAVK